MTTPDTAGDHERRYNRDEDAKSRPAGGGPPRPATEPDRAERPAPKTITDPATGEPRGPA